jgi:hypothetical protein
LGSSLAQALRSGREGELPADALQAFNQFMRGFMAVVGNNPTALDLLRSTAPQTPNPLVILPNPQRVQRTPKPVKPVPPPKLSKEDQEYDKAPWAQKDKKP